MNISKSEVENLEKWLSPRLGSLIAHGEKVREMLRAANGPTGIIPSAIQLVTGQQPQPANLSPNQMAVWKALLPILAEHGLMAVRGGGGPAELEPKALTKQEAAEFLGLSISKLNRCLRKRQIQFEKYGSGKTASVRFRLPALIEFQNSRTVAVKGKVPAVPPPVGTSSPGNANFYDGFTPPVKKQGWYKWNKFSGGNNSP